MPQVIHGDGQRFAPEPGQEAPIAEQLARLKFVVSCVDFQHKRVLDCGCGTGYSLDFLASQIPSAQYLGIDIEKSALDYARRKYSQLDFLAMDGFALGFKAESFDIVLSFEVLEHLLEDQQRGYLKEIHRVLKPGGILILSTPNREIFSMGHKESLNIYHVQEPTFDELLRLLSRFFQSVNIYGQYFFNNDLRNKDISYLRQQFSFPNRLKRSISRKLKKTAVFQTVYSVITDRRKRKSYHKHIYPIKISTEDFAFDDKHLQISKWFLSICRREI